MATIAVAGTCAADRHRSEYLGAAVGLSGPTRARCSTFSPLPYYYLSSRCADHARHHPWMGEQPDGFICAPSGYPARGALLGAPASRTKPYALRERRVDQRRWCAVFDDVRFVDPDRIGHPDLGKMLTGSTLGCRLLFDRWSVRRSGAAEEVSNNLLGGKGRA
jgi:branched-chain amino acid transport system permease protein